jgi:acyl carrier protein
MNEADIRAAVLQALRSIAPEVPSDRIRPGEDLRDQLDLDSMDVVNLLAALEEKLGVHIEETDHARLATLDGAVAYLLNRAAPDRTRSR